MKVYVIGEGEYSDFDVIGVFGTLPEKYKGQNCPLGISIEEFELDLELLPGWKYFPYLVRTDINTGTTIVTLKYTAWFDSSSKTELKNKIFLHKSEYYNKANPNTLLDCLTVVVDAKNKEHAIKIAIDLFAQYLVEQEVNNDL